MHWRIERLLEATNRTACRSVYRRTVPINLERGIVSFTFDDFPASAYHVGGNILRNQNARGTFYVAMGLMNTGSGECFSAQDVQQLVDDGHELGNHSYSHLDCRGASGAAMQADVTHNASVVSTLLPGYSMHNFSYPGGRLSVATKRIGSRMFSTCRGTEPGLNVGKADLGELKANKIYERLQNRPELVELIRTNARQRGWLIFYTHDVADTPSQFGASPALLEELVASARESKCDILTVRNALGALAFRI
jgi:peptidoglycan/xylan/chitin deacetylase (PgdA/CDA1 family)